MVLPALSRQAAAKHSACLHQPFRMPDGVTLASCRRVWRDAASRARLRRMARLSVNLNKVALLRNSRRTGVPDVLHFARLALDAGAAGLTVHPRPDERHIRGSDVPALAALMQPVRPGVEFNIEGYPDARLHEILAAVRPEQPEPRMTVSRVSIIEFPIVDCRRARRFLAPQALTIRGGGRGARLHRRTR